MSRIVLVLFTFFLFWSCVEPIDFTTEEEMPAVVNCILTHNSKQQLYLYYAKRIKETQYVNITDASVKVIGAGNTYDFSWDGEAWTSYFTPEYGEEYTLEINLNDGSSLSSKTIFPKYMKIYSFFRLDTDIPLYSPFFPHPIYSNKYCCVKECDDEAFIWLTAEGGIQENTNISTNHTGADNTNVVSGSWDNLEMSNQVYSDLERLVKYGFENEAKIAKEYYKLCLGLPLHKGYLRIHHEHLSFAKFYTKKSDSQF